MRALLISACLLNVGSVSSVQAASPAKLMGKDSACALLKSREAIAKSIPKSGPAGMGWFCDFDSFKDPRDQKWFLISLRSNRQCDGPCSNLMGWFAIDRRHRTIHSFDMGEFEIGPLIEYGK